MTDRWFQDAFEGLVVLRVVTSTMSFVSSLSWVTSALRSGRGLGIPLPKLDALVEAGFCLVFRVVLSGGLLFFLRVLSGF